ncbi:RNA polymerase sigma factor [Amycolatopsis minnesotensis]|uniref:RNA polymerase sigma factor 70 region 4 type 2 domain-containing protein n=1 Tax=Amycolatopsis minnesotensis TaxID=337894 RepID=A0ABN2SA47_9PSEU
MPSAQTRPPEAAGRPEIGLARRLTQGDNTAFAEFYARTFDTVCTALHRQGWPPSQIADAAQDAYLQLDLHAPRIREPERMVGWLLTVARRRLMQESSVPVVTMDAATTLADAPTRVGEDHPESMADADALRTHLRQHLSAADMKYVNLLDAGSAGSAQPNPATEPFIPPAKLSAVRARARKALLGSDWDYEVRPAAIVCDPQPLQDPKAIAQSTLEDAIRTLPARQREVLNYVVYRGMKPREIAVQLGITANSARVNRYYARETLARRLWLSVDAVENLLRELTDAHHRHPDAAPAPVALEKIAIVLDVVRFRDRGASAQRKLRTRLQNLVDELLHDQAMTASTGDSLLTFLPMSCWRPGFVASCVQRLQDALAWNNRTHHEDPIQLRVMLSCGRIHTESKPFTSAVAIDLLRAVESDTVRQVRPPDTPLILFVADQIHDVMRNGGHALPPGMVFAEPLTIDDKKHTRPLKVWPLTRA